jgi:hypothetical protein
VKTFFSFSRNHGRRFPAIKDRFVWENPNPEIEIRSIYLVSSMTQAAPFLMAITKE